ncbi:MAG: AlwI family type II restriction endonuclease [Clostridium sp.]|uniref:AlwI family type II restriction endonuclease n=1 Tax=Clostridium sp. TaxID=1506 RepID=UPI003F347CE0
MFEIDKGAITWNLGDTSFRRKALVHDYRILLSELSEMKEENANEWNANIQAGYYNSVRTNSHIKISSEINEVDKMAKMGRTFTSGLFKMGFCDKKRNLTDIGLQFLNKKEIILDDFERRLNLKNDNIIFLRQLLKLYIWDKDVELGFNPFVFLIKILNKYDYLEKEEFEAIIQVSSGKVDFNKVLCEFEKVRNGNISLEEFFNRNLENNTSRYDIEQFTKGKSVSEEIFKSIFYNRKTATSRDKYFDFYNQLMRYKVDKKNQEELDKLIVYLKDDIIKKAFNISTIFSNLKKKLSCEKFLEEYSEVGLIKYEDEKFKNEFLEVFIKAKREDIVKEYRDMTYRIFNISGILNTRNSVIKIENIYAKEYFKEIDNYLNITINDKTEDISKIITINEILQCNKTQKIDAKLKNEYKLDNKLNIIEYLAKKEEQDFNEFVKREFSKKKIIKILEEISLRNDKNIFEIVTDQTTVPTIFEYILGIAWLYISDFQFNLLESLNLTLDSNYYPLSHAAGGDGDIVINYEKNKKHLLMLEATLMDINTQKRGELEPVVRHSVNLKIKAKKNNINAYSIFVANELDNNVINIFRTCNLLNLESSFNKGKFTVGTKIVAFKISEIISILEKDIKYDKIFNAIEYEFEDDSINRINNSWREKFINRII